jgi:hypothetical protein
MVRLSPVSGSPSRWSYRGSDFRIGSKAVLAGTSSWRQLTPRQQTKSLQCRSSRRFDRGEVLGRKPWNPAEGFTSPFSDKPLVGPTRTPWQWNSSNRAWPISTYSKM